MLETGEMGGTGSSSRRRLDCPSPYAPLNFWVYRDAEDRLVKSWVSIILTDWMCGKTNSIAASRFGGIPPTEKAVLGQHLRARGYFCASIGAVDEETIRRYIENQQWDDPGENFKITAPSEP